MLLRRIAKHLRQQNWTAIFLEFLIVVGGVFIGLQAADWSVERQDRKDEVYYLDRILDDIDESVAKNDDVIAFMDTKVRDSNWVVRQLRRGELDPREEQLFETRFLSIGLWQTGDFIDSTLSELQTTGRAHIIQSQAFWEQMARFDLELESYQRAQTNIADFHKTLTLQIAEQFDQQRTDEFHASLAQVPLPRITEEEMAQQRELLTPFGELARDELLIRRLERFAEFYYWRRDNVAELQDQLASLREATVVALDGRTI